MVNTTRLRSRMVRKDFTQRSLVAALNAKGLKISENTLSSKMQGRTQFDCDEADAICEILGLSSPAEKAEIFLA